MEAFLKNFDLVPFDLVMIAIGAVLFVCLWQILRIVVFQPYLKLVDARERATSGAEAQARANEERAMILFKEYEQKLMEERAVALKVKFEALSKAKAEAGRMINKAESEAQSYLEGVRKELDKEVGAVKQRVAFEAETLAGLLAERAKILMVKAEVARK